MVSIKLDTDSMRFVALFENITGAIVKDCIVSVNKVVFIVKEGQAGLAIGRAGSNVISLQNKLRKRIEIIEFSSDPLKFAANLFHPAELSKSYVSENSSGKKILYLNPKSDRGLVRSKLRYALDIIQRYHSIDTIKLG
jgi:N utilization substance protein A